MDLLNKLKRIPSSNKHTENSRSYRTSDSFSFYEKVTKKEYQEPKPPSCRRKLQDNFEDSPSGRNGFGVLSLDDARKLLRLSGERINKSFGILRTSFGNFTQIFKVPTKRRSILQEAPMTPCNHKTPQIKKILGRTPTKLYSPFSIDSPNSDMCKIKSPEM